ncbi:DUF1697 domain-containing protein [Microbacterium ulmi]|uniref:DUF1697 domain-containing protein n=1 Tax=Microbacterium ulmi TaxID=179095 RepID=A0A7Y2Q1S5_9MICO|nr:DUF1697 domain-containing protein [Microbacterium ulmi]NII70994.1 uncharacterized protein (DUF1697 family) [Microbacterium ulmi]NNH04240.1 DUF1697 domain-containing protein [Microbacterium ulmi]
MTTWVALLRGVNVGGITIRSADLGALFREQGFDDVRTFLASGNVRFETDAAAVHRAALKSRIEAALRDRFSYDAWIVLVTRSELDAAIDGFPFDADNPARQPWVVFCTDEATRTELAAAAASLDPSVDPISTGPGVVYWNPVKGTTVDTPFAKMLAKARYKATTTNRNLRTLVKIAS